MLCSKTNPVLSDMSTARTCACVMLCSNARWFTGLLSLPVCSVAHSPNAETFAHTAHTVLCSTSAGAHSHPCALKHQCGDTCLNPGERLWRPLLWVCKCTWCDALALVLASLASQIRFPCFCTPAPSQRAPRLVLELAHSRTLSYSSQAWPPHRASLSLAVPLQRQSVPLLHIAYPLGPEG